MTPADAGGGLVGLVLAGGLSRRMGADKGALGLDGQSLTERALMRLEPFCAVVCVSIRTVQVAAEPYRRLKTVVDDGSVVGPAAGLLAAWQEYAGRALLVLAADLAQVSPALLAALVAGRQADGRLATAFRHPNGIPEPLCAIWEPAAQASILASDMPGSPSLRHLLETGPARLLEPEWPGQLTSINTPEQYARLQTNAG